MTIPTPKRFLDLLVACTALVVAAPVLITAAIYIRLASAGPVFFRQERVGQGGRPFSILKLRTMTWHPSSSEQTVSLRNDPRVFFGGSILRSLKIDELPQLLNVVAGQMSLVGPRPTVASDHARMTARQQQRVSVRPGMTGLAQVNGNTSLSWPERIEWDLRYIARQSVWMDLQILARTAGLVLSARAATHPAGDDEWRQASPLKQSSQEAA